MRFDASGLDFKARAGFEAPGMGFRFEGWSSCSTVGFQIPVKIEMLVPHSVCEPIISKPK